jgi:hypothetical protein
VQKSLFIALRAKLYFKRLCKSLLPPTAAEYSFERHVIFAISRSEIAKMTCLSKHNSARSAVKKTFHITPKEKILPPQAAKYFPYSSYRS